MIDITDAAYISRIELRNFRPFKHLEMDLHSRLTVLVADNGGGKTAILDALCLILQAVLDPLTGEKRDIKLSDVRKVVGRHGEMVDEFPASIHIWGSLFGMAGDWYIAKGSASRVDVEEKTSTARDLKQFRTEVVEYSAGKRARSPLLPLVAYYGARRNWEDNNRRAGPGLRRTAQHSKMDRSSGYYDAFTPNHHYLFVREWFKRLSFDAKSGQKSLFPSPYDSENRLAVVRNATNVVLRPVGWSELEWDFPADTLIATHPEKGRFPIDCLSEGIRSILGVVADLAYRATHLNPHLGEEAAIESPGIVMIDEIDLHLHPRWQQLIITTLLEAFPKVQFIVTTHSSHVLSTVDVHSIRVLNLRNEARGVELPQFQTRGVESSDVLAAIMGVDPIPAVEEAAWVSRYRALIEDGNDESPEGQELRVRLVHHFGASHPIMLDCDRLIRWRAFNARRTSKREAGTLEKT